MCLKEIINLLLKNLSTRELFQFGISCEECGTLYTSPAEAFSKANLEPESQSKQVIFLTLYEQEMAEARQKSLTQLAEHMNRCPICKHLVCNRCFLICDDLDMCISCASNLNEAGEPVYCDLKDIKG